MQKGSRDTEGFSLRVILHILAEYTGFLERVGKMKTEIVMCLEMTNTSNTCQKAHPQSKTVGEISRISALS